MQFRKFTMDSIRPEMFFLIIGFVFGLIFIVITPPYQSPDEVVHFYRAYQISEGTVGAVQQNNRVGGSIPKSIVNTADSATSIFGNIAEKVSNVWTKLDQLYTITEDMANQNFSIYIYNSSLSDTAYFDNVKISYKKIR